MRYFRSFLIAFLLLVVLAVPVLAVAYTLTMHVTEEDGNDYDMIATQSLFGIEWMVDTGYMQSDGLDTLAMTQSDQLLPHLLATDRILTALPVPAFAWLTLHITTDNSPKCSMDIINGYDGYDTITDDASLELSDDFKIDIFAYIDTDSGANKNIIYKNGAIRLYVSNDEEITLTITGGPTLVVTGVPSGEYFIRVWADGTDVSLYIE